MAGFDHTSVLAAEVLEHLGSQNDGVYVDGTLGGAGHAAALLDHLTNAALIGIDRDPSALEAARQKLERFGDRVRLIHGEYADMPRILAELEVGPVSGILLDLGVSSPQLDQAERGFSFTKSGPLDMRMDPTRGRTALELINELDQEELAEVIKELGEERHGKKVARLIKEAVLADKVHTTTDLAAVIAQAIPIFEQRKSKIHPATRTFQALRIAVNAELVQLERFLFDFPDLLAPDGRCAVISFHSLEDRLVKNRFRDLGWTTSLPRHLAEQAGERVEPVCELVTRKAVFGSEEEIARNPRARSARLRVCERTAAPNVPAMRTGPSPISRSR
ncbi:MAG: 16S rRNA (cytosine(1402)-N(4))-methyltransferase RsmH [Deltaproteobacteria bacterium]|nr:16S rRNA (cytosine(1402)-N(4))-methyltransferase RsmH [Deltaproteobacteria bacterium]